MPPLSADRDAFMPLTATDISGYRYRDAESNHSHAYLHPPVFERLRRVDFPRDAKRVFDLGCGNGSTAARLHRHGYTVAGVDPSEEGIRQAQAQYPDLDLRVGSAYDDLRATFGRFAAVISLEVVEHVYDPRAYAQTVFDLLHDGGTAILSTPYHGYWKNLVIALTGAYDRHHNPLWDHGHIKFWSRDTLGTLLEETGFVDVQFERVGRIPPLAKSMVATARKPASDDASA